ncbi:TPA: host nuclease inhibitor protein [Serratia marcescens]
MAKIFAYAWASGLIEFGTEYPAGALPIYAGEDAPLRDAVTIHARHARTSESLFVPGIPEAANQHEALDVLIDFSDRIKTAYLRSK